MPWCPKCRCEYREGFNICSDCSCELVEEIENKEEKAEINYDNEVLLRSVSDRAEADFIEAIMNENGIPVLMKYKAAGAYLDIYMGMNSFGVNIYVPSKLVENAQALLEQKTEYYDELSWDKSCEDEFIESKKRNDKKRKFRTWIIIMFFMPGLAGIIIAIILAIILRVS